MPAEVVSITGARLAFGERVLWDHLDLCVSAGEFIAVLGPNGTGKTSLIKVLLGQVPLSAGTALIEGQPVRPGSDRIGYVPQRTRRGPRSEPVRRGYGPTRRRRPSLGARATATRRAQSTAAKRSTGP